MRYKREHYGNKQGNVSTNNWTSFMGFSEWGNWNSSWTKARFWGKHDHVFFLIFLGSFMASFERSLKERNREGEKIEGAFCEEKKLVCGFLTFC